MKSKNERENIVYDMKWKLNQLKKYTEGKSGNKKKIRKFNRNHKGMRVKPHQCNVEMKVRIPDTERKIGEIDISEMNISMKEYDKIFKILNNHEILATAKESNINITWIEVEIETQNKTKGIILSKIK